jgi:hypothetical protein
LRSHGPCRCLNRRRSSGLRRPSKTLSRRGEARANDTSRAASYRGALFVSLVRNQEWGAHHEPVFGNVLEILRPLPALCGALRALPRGGAVHHHPASRGGAGGRGGRNRRGGLTGLDVAGGPRRRKRPSAWRLPSGRRARESRSTGVSRRCLRGRDGQRLLRRHQDPQHGVDQDLAARNDHEQQDEQESGCPRTEPETTP